MNWLRRFFAAEGGSIMVLSAFSLTAIMGMTGLAVEVGNGYATKVRNQRVADVAALGAALSYGTNSDVAKATQTAKDIVTASGLPASAATVSVNSSSAQVQVTTAVPVRLASLISTSTSYNVTNIAEASIGGSISPACVLSLSKTATVGVDMQGSVALDATGCAVSSNKAITVGGSSALTAATIVAPSVSTSGKSTANGTKVTGSTASDPLATNTALAAAFAQLGITNSPTSPVLPDPPTFVANSSNWSFPSSASAFSALPNSDLVKANCSLSGQIFTCNQGNYQINNFTVPNGFTVLFLGNSSVNIYGTLSANGAFLNGTQTNYNLKNAFSTGWGSSPTFGNIASLYVGGSVTYSGPSNSIGSGTITIAGTLKVSGSSSLTIGAGVHNVGGIDISGSGNLSMGAGDLVSTGSITIGGSATASFGAGNFVVGQNSKGQSIDDAGSLSFGNGNFSGTGAIYVSGGTTLTMGTGNITLGADSKGNSIDLQGSGSLSMGAGNLSADGSVSTQGSSNITFGTGKHSIDGDLNISGASTLGAGGYYVNGNFNKSASLGVTANGVTIIASGFYAIGGSSTLQLSAPTADNTATGALKGIAFASQTTQNSSVTGSASNTFSGVFYTPNSNVSVSGSGTVAGPTCFAMVVNTLSISGSGSLTDKGCTSPTVSSAGSVALIR